MQNNNSLIRRRGTKQTQNVPEPEPKRETVYPNDNHERGRRGRIKIIELPILSEANRISVLFYLSGCLCRSLKCFCFCFGFCSCSPERRARERGRRRVAHPRSGSTSCCQLWKCKMPGRVSSLTFDKDVNRNWQQDRQYRMDRVSPVSPPGRYSVVYG